MDKKYFGDIAQKRERNIAYNKSLILHYDIREIMVTVTVIKITITVTVSAVMENACN